MFRLEISPNLSKLYGIQIKQTIVIQSKQKILDQIGNIQKIVNCWLKIIQLKEILTDSTRFAKFQVHLERKNKIEEWKKEPEYLEFLQIGNQLIEAEKTYISLKSEYRIVSITFLKDSQTSLYPPKNTQEKVVA